VCVCCFVCECVAELDAHSSPRAQETNGKYLMTPAVRRLVGEHNVDLSKVAATGKVWLIVARGSLLLLDKVRMRSLQPRKNVPSPGAALTDSHRTGAF
jgi:pyruvate/2-oxoglutarate dehydrogenase complex dihydrolipoamide acyltransferase (E2) component